MHRTWLEPIPVTISDIVFEATGENVFLSEYLTRKSLDTHEKIQGFLFPEEYRPASPFNLHGMDVAVERINNAIAHQETIGVWGDFDVDGQTATTILVSVIRLLGGKVHYHIPVRATESHGIRLPNLVEFLQNDIRLLLTCDTGISEFEASDYCSEHDIPLIITDHHALPDHLPRALVILNPMLSPGTDPLRTLSGAGVAYKLAEALLNARAQEKDLTNLQDLVVLGLVADQAVLINDTRFLVQKGLSVIRQGKRKSLSKMLEMAGVKNDQFSEEHINFIIAPRLNAIGRLSDANIIVEFLMSQDDHFISDIVKELEQKNSERKMLSDQVFSAATHLIDSQHELSQGKVIVIAHKNWPAGVLGLVAGRLAEIYSKPVILCNETPEGMIRGSARSISGVNIIQSISACAPFLESFGGHPMAAGLALHNENLFPFIKQLNRQVDDQIAERPPLSLLPIESYLKFENIKSDFVSQIEALSPFGQGNPAPVFATRNVSLKSKPIHIGSTKEHVRLTLFDSEQHEQQFIWWQGAGNPVPEGNFDIAFSARFSNFRGQKEIQLEWIDSRDIKESPFVLSSPSLFEIEDHRNASNPDLFIRNNSLNADSIVFGEGPDLPFEMACDRNKLTRSTILVISTIPPDRTTLRMIIATTRPQKILLFAFDPCPKSVKEFMNALGGLALFTIRNKAGILDYTKIAARLGYPDSTIRLGLDWLQEHGDIVVCQKDQSSCQISPGNHTPSSFLIDLQSRLEFQIGEVRAFRSYFKRADANLLLQG
jgi:single-stranded-DNA-specific exonuclease